MIRSLLVRAGALAAAALVTFGVLAFTSSGFAADQRRVFQGLNGQPGTWVQVLRDSFGKVYLTLRVYDLQTASNLTDPSGGQVVSPVKGKISRIYYVLVASASNATTAASNVLVAFISGNGDEVTGGNITIAASSVEGASGSTSPTAANSVVAGDIIEIQSSGSDTTQMDAVIVIEIDRDV